MKSKDENARCTMDVNEEYESVFGVTLRPTLFAPDDVEYLSLRQEIVDTAVEINKNNNLPFEGVKIIPYYKLYKKNDITAPGHTSQVSPVPFVVKHMITSIINTLLCKESIQSDNESYEKQHIFYLKVNGVCDASGYYIEENNRFVLIKGSKFFSTASEGFSKTSMGIARKQFIAAACGKNQFGYIVKTDTPCISARAAASYLMGRATSYVCWRDKNGKYLKDFYPSSFMLPKNDIESEKIQETSERTESEIHLFHIKEDTDVSGACNATGYYDAITKKFIIKAGSYLSLETAIYNITHRRVFLNKFCSKESKGYRLRKDSIFESSSAAATIVLGRLANGLEEWIDDNNQTLDEVYYRK